MKLYTAVFQSLLWFDIFMFFGLEICARHIFTLALKEMFVMVSISSTRCLKTMLI
jgi:hypothetical protein